LHVESRISYSVDRVTTTTCSIHKEIPAEDCNCGMYTTMDLDAVAKFIDQDQYVDMKEVIFPVMGVFQVIGRAFIDGYTIRSHGVYLWGLIRPTKLAEYSWGQCVSRLFGYGLYNPVCYSKLAYSFLHALPAWVDFCWDSPAIKKVLEGYERAHNIS